MRTDCILSFFIIYGGFESRRAKAWQDEVDLLLGGKRLPSLSDYGTLPYVESIMRGSAEMESSVTTRSALML